MKKVFALLCVVLALSCVLCSCGPQYTWQDNALKDIAKLTEAGFTVYNEDTAESVESCTESLNFQLKHDKQDFTVELVHITSLYEDMLTIVSFEEFATEQQAKQMYDYHMQMDTVQKYVRFGKILVNTNSEKAEELLGYDFKVSPAYTNWDD